jgi:acetyltransferase
MKLDSFFIPASIAVIGASDDPTKVGYALLANVKSDGSRRIYPVSLNQKVVQGLPAFNSIADVPETPDLVLIAVRADIVPAVLSQCADKGVKTTIVISAGFKEAGESGKVLEQQIKDVAKNRNIAVLGPNCLGTIDMHTRCNASFGAQVPKAGPIAFVSQSGALGTALLDRALADGIGFSKFVSLGNKASLSEIDFLEYLENDEQTKAILMYLESIENGERFVEICKRITPRKPIVVIKAGTSERGASAVASHTGSLAPASLVFSAACKSAGIIEATSYREFFNIAKLLTLNPSTHTPWTRLAIVTNGGGPSVIATDLIEHSHSLTLADFSEETKQALRNVLPPMAGVGNPVDVIGDALPARYAGALNIVSALPDVDAILVILTPQMMTDVVGTANLLIERKNGKPLIHIFTGGPFIEKGLMRFTESGIPNFLYPADAIEALDALARGSVKKPSTGRKTDVRPDTRTLMPFLETQALLSSYYIDIAGVFAQRKEDVAAAFVTCGGAPCVMKAFSPDVVHKTDHGAVEFGIADPIAATESWDRIENRIRATVPDVHFDGMLIQPSVKGKEIIIGMKRDASFGPTILVGLGGIFAEALKDVSVRLAPVPKADAFLMFEELKGFAILHGLRGESPVNFEALAHIVTNLSRLAIDHPEIKEIDLNPVFATTSEATIVDARIMR